MYFSIIVWFFKKPFSLKLTLLPLFLVGRSSKRHFTYHSGINSIPPLLFSLSSWWFSIVTRTMRKRKYVLSLIIYWREFWYNCNSRALFPWGLCGSQKSVSTNFQLWYLLCSYLTYVAPPSSTSAASNIPPCVSSNKYVCICLWLASSLPVSRLTWQDQKSWTGQ